MPRFFPLTIADLRRETPDCLSLSFALPEALRDRFRFVQGQHVILRATIGGEELRRTYSICSAVDEGELRIAVKRQPHGRFSGWLHERVRPGDRIEVMPPRGRFFVPLDPEARRRYVAFAAGSGITPLASILKTTLAREPKSRFTLFYGNRNVESIIFLEELEDLKNRYMTRFALHHVLSAGTSDVMELFSGRITPEKLRAWAGRLFRPEEIDAWFLCGPAPMIQELADTLVGFGVEKSRIHYEYFTTEGNRPRRPPHAPPPVEAAGDRAEITVLLDGQRRDFSLAFNSETILDGAIADGIDPPYSCKAGVCSTCRARVIEGKVDMAVNYALEDWEVERGFVLTCQARPLTSRVVVDYDES